MFGTLFIVSRLAGGMIKVGNNSDGTMNPVCAVVTMEQTDANQLIELTCNMEGRYLSVELTGTKPLHICELQANQCSKCKGVVWHTGYVLACDAVGPRFKPR